VRSGFFIPLAIIVAGEKLMKIWWGSRFIESASLESQIAERNYGRIDRIFTG
jgi:hypothetical protein